MNEKEFLVIAFEHIFPDALDSLKPSEMNDRIDEFLKYQHKTYLPVLFLPISYRHETYKKMVREQAKIKMADFFQFAGLEFTEEIAAKLEAYWDKALNTV